MAVVVPKGYSEDGQAVLFSFLFLFWTFFLDFCFFFFVGVRAEGSDVGATSRASENDVHWLCMSAPNIAPSTARTNRLAASQMADTD